MEDGYKIIYRYKDGKLRPMKFKISSTNEFMNNLLRSETNKTPINEKEEQFKIIQKENPMLDDYHTGIRSVDDIKTWEEVLQLDDDSEGQFVWGDYTRADAERDFKKGTITIYSSKPIKNGTFVSSSKIQAEEYAGGIGNKVYSKEVPLNEIAWINGDEGQYAKIKK